MLEERDRRAQIPLPQVEKSEPEIGADATVGVIHRLGNPHPFLAPQDPLREISTLGQRADQKGAREDRKRRKRPRLPKTLTDELTLERLDVAVEILARAAKVSQAEVSLPQALIGYDLEGEIPLGLGDGKGAMAKAHSAVKIARYPEIMRYAASIAFMIRAWSVRCRPSRTHA